MSVCWRDIRRMSVSQQDIQSSKAAFCRPRMSVCWHDIQRMSVSQQDIQRPSSDCCQQHACQHQSPPSMWLWLPPSTNQDRNHIHIRIDAERWLVLTWAIDGCFGASVTFVNVWCQVSKTFAETFKAAFCRSRMSVCWHDIRRMSVSQQDIRRRPFWRIGHICESLGVKLARHSPRHLMTLRVHKQKKIESLERINFVPTWKNGRYRIYPL